MSNSPFKPTASPATRASLTANLKESGLAKELSVTEFAGAFFRNPLQDSECTPCIPQDASTIIASIGRCTEKEAYMPTCKLLTGICDKYAGQYGVAQDDQLAFVVHYDHVPCQHPHSYTAAVAGQKPDIVATWKWLAKKFVIDVAGWVRDKSTRPKDLRKPAVAWPVMGSLVEGKGPTDSNAHWQAATYLGSLLLARPDLIGCFGLAIDAKSFRLIWCDVSGVFFTNTISWSDRQATTLLVQYVRQLHNPLVDPTIRLKKPDPACDTPGYLDWPDKCYAAPPIWHVEDEKGVVYVVDKILSVGPAWSRKNWVARASERLGEDGKDPVKLEPPIVIKDSFIRPERAELSSEGDILHHIHLKGQVPGVVSMHSQFHVVDRKKNPIRNVQLPPDLDASLHAPTRVRYRLFLLAYKLDHIFTACSSVKECLEVIYDVLELSRYLHEEYEITHRDISPFNVLVEGNAATLTVPSCTKYSPVFIRQLLSYRDPEPAPNTPTCLILDFDNAFWADKSTGALRTATPGFAARALSLRRLVAAHRPDRGQLPEIPVLQGMAKDAYLRFHGDERYELSGAFHAGAVVAEVDDDPDLLIAPHSSASDADENPFNPIAVSRQSPDPDEDDFANLAVIPHLPRHEAESSYWVLVWILITALPRGALIKDDNTKPMSELMVHFDSHRVGVTMVRDERSNFFELDRVEWRAILHRDFRSLAPFLTKLSKVVKPEYGWVKSDLNLYHLHEAMQRVILQEVCRLEQAGDPLNIEGTTRRKVLTRSPADEGLAATAMRAHEACSARESVAATSQATGETRQTRSGKRRLAASTWPALEASTSEVANARQKKQKTAKAAQSPTRASTRPRKPRGQ